MPALASLVLILSVLPLIPGEVFGRIGLYDAARAWQGLALLGAIVMLGIRPKSPAKINVRPWMLLAVLGALSCMGAAVPSMAWREVVWAAACLAWPSLLARDLRNPLMRSRALDAIVIGQFVYVLLVSAMLLHGLLAEQLFDAWRVFPGYENPRYFNHTQTLSIPLLLAYSLSLDAPRLLRRLAGFAVALHVLLISVFLARATVIALTAAVLVVTAILRERRLFQALVYHAALGALLYLIGFKFLPHLLGIEAPSFRDPGERGSVETRLFLWNIALEAIREHPWLGVGPMHFAHTLNGEAAHPHNIYLQIASEYGLLFAATALAMLTRWLYRLISLMRQRSIDGALTLIEVGCLASIVGALVDGLFSGNFVMPMSQSWIALCVALPATSQDGQGAQAPSASHAWLTRGVSIGVAVGLAATLAAMSQELVQADLNLVHGQSLMHGHLSPRFWLDGWF